MKRLFTIMLTAIILISCNNNGSSKTNTTSKRDTSSTVVFYFNPFTRLFYHDVASKIRWDTLKFVYTDTVKNKEKYAAKDSVYIMYVQVPVYDSITNKPVTDSLGRLKYKEQWQSIGPSLVLIDAGVNVEAVTKAFLKKYSITTLQPKVDTTKK